MTWHILKEKLDILGKRLFPLKKWLKGSSQALNMPLFTIPFSLAHQPELLLVSNPSDPTGIWNLVMPFNHEISLSSRVHFHL